MDLELEQYGDSRRVYIVGDVQDIAFSVQTLDLLRNANFNACAQTIFEIKSIYNNLYHVQQTDIHIRFISVYKLESRYSGIAARLVGAPKLLSLLSLNREYGWSVEIITSISQANALEVSRLMQIINKSEDPYSMVVLKKYLYYNLVI